MASSSSIISISGYLLEIITRGTSISELIFLKAEFQEV